MHMCVLKEKGSTDLIRTLSEHPTVECRHCGAKANSLRYICAAHLGDNAPNVEGGHGSVGPEETGKPHAGKKEGNR
jgi:hypothetical protein